MTPTSHSELACFRRCPQEWVFSYEKKRASRITPEALSVGKRVHAALGQVHRKEVPTVPADAPIETAMVCSYGLFWRQSPIEVLETDVFFLVPISDDVAITGELDAIAWDPKRSEKRIVLEHKTTNEDISPGSQYWRRIVHADVQASMYLAAAKHLKLDDTFLLWDVLRKPALRQGKSETPQQFAARCTRDMAERPDHYFRRATIVRFDHEHEAHLRDIHSTVHLMQVVREMPSVPRNRDACFRYGRACDFFDVCSGEVELEDETRFQENEHVVTRAKKIEAAGLAREAGEPPA